MRVKKLAATTALLALPLLTACQATTPTKQDAHPAPEPTQTQTPSPSPTQSKYPSLGQEVEYGNGILIATSKPEEIEITQDEYGTPIPGYDPDSGNKVYKITITITNNSNKPIEPFWVHASAAADGRELQEIFYEDYGRPITTSIIEGSKGILDVAYQVPDIKQVTLDIDVIPADNRHVIFTN